MRIVVYGSPAPQGSKSFKGMLTGKDGRSHAVLAESSKKVKPWRQDVVAAAVEARAAAGDPAPLDCALSVRMIFTLPKPKSAPKRKRIYAMRKPDVSKLARSTEDALTTAMIWTDDSRVAEYARLAKVFPGEDPESLKSPSVIIEITTIEGTIHESDLFTQRRRTEKSSTRNV
jgi:crossover junction endodeoxyribonuclease RusA